MATITGHKYANTFLNGENHFWNGADTRHQKHTNLIVLALWQRLFIWTPSTLQEYASVNNTSSLQISYFCSGIFRPKNTTTKQAEITALC
jgi:hypothetical protein